MKRYALIKDGVVQNIIICDDEFISHYKDKFITQEVSAEPGSPGLGWAHIKGDQFVAPIPQEQPESIEDKLQQLDAKLASVSADVAVLKK